MLSQDIVTLSRSTEALKISRIITRKTAKRAIKKAITGVVPQPGETFPYSEFRGFSRVPRLVTKPLSKPSLPQRLVFVNFGINKIKKKLTNTIYNVIVKLLELSQRLTRKIRVNKL